MGIDGGCFALRVSDAAHGVGISPGIFIGLGDTLMALRQMDSSVYRISIN